MFSSHSSLNAAFHSLSTFLIEQHDMLAIHPIHWALRSPVFPWGTAVFNEALLSLDESDLAQMEGNPELAARYFARFFPALQSLSVIEEQLFPDLQHPSLEPPLPFWIENGIGGRKLTQIKGFLAAVTAQGKPNTVMEWCAGKGYLGRVAAQRGMQVISIELQQSLCQKGAATASQWGLSQTFLQVDVLKKGVEFPFKEIDAAFALHACGGLHVSLLNQSVTAKLPMLALAPCCYHLHTDQIYRPLSSAGSLSKLSLTREQLKFSVQGQATGGERIEKLRHQEVQWRLAYESWRQEVTASHAYRPLSSAPKQIFNDTFNDFACWATEQHELSASFPSSWEPYLDRAKAHYLHLRRIEAVRSILRRPLELWLVLDRALYLSEHGYEVSLGRFCARTTSPRNLLIMAVRRANA